MIEKWLREAKAELTKQVVVSEEQLQSLLSDFRNRTVVLFGTDHSYQTGLRWDTIPPSVRPSWVIHKYQDRVVRYVDQFGIVAVAEEMNKEGIRRVREKIGNLGTDSSGQLTTYTMECLIPRGIEVRLVDPDPEQQQKSGIKDEQDFGLNFGKQGLIFGRHQNSTLREHYWAERIAEWDQWPLLFICGSYHRKTFGHLLRRFGVQVRDIFWNPYGSR